MLSLEFVRENPEIVKQNIKDKFQDSKLGLVDEVTKLDAKNRVAKAEADNIRAEGNKLSKQMGALTAQKKKKEAEEMKKLVTAGAERLATLEAQEEELEEKARKIMMIIPSIIDPSVPIGKDDSGNVEVERYGEPVVPDFEIPYHTEIMESFDGVDLDSAREVAGNGFYYLMGGIAGLHSAAIFYARDFMIDRGLTYCVPPFMIRSEVVTSIVSFAEMDTMMYKIEGEDSYLISTSEHSTIGKFIDTILPEESLPGTLTSYSPRFRKEKGVHGLEERGVYRIHQLEKREVVVVCKPKENPMWYDKLWQNTVDLFRSLDIPVRTLECCSGDLADLKMKSMDVEAWFPRQKKYFEVGSCSNLGDAQARRLKICVNGADGKCLAHTLDNTVVTPPRMLIAFLEDNLQIDGSVRIPVALQPYMGGETEIRKKQHDHNDSRTFLRLLCALAAKSCGYQQMGLPEIKEKENFKMMRFNHFSFNVLDLRRSLKFYKDALDLSPMRTKEASDSSFKLVYLGDGESDLTLELAWLEERMEPYDLGEYEFHLALTANDYEATYKRHRELGVICYENPAMGICLISDPDGYWIEIVPVR